MPKAASSKAAFLESAPSKPAKAALAKSNLEKTVTERQLPEVVLAVEPSASLPTVAKPAIANAAADKPKAEKPAAAKLAEAQVAKPAAARPAAAKPAVAKPAGFSAPVQEAAPVEDAPEDDAPNDAEPDDADLDDAEPVEAAAEEAAPKPAAEPERRPPSPPEGERRPNINDRNPPRIPSKAENFVAGDHVVYPTHGVGKVERIVVEEIAGHSLELIHITFEENRMTLRVPVSKARSAGLRKLASRKMFDEALAVLKGRARIKRTMWSRRAQEYEAKINSGDPLSIAEVVRDLHRNAGQPDQSFSERQIYEAAMDRLAAELGALDKTDKPTAAIKLLNFLKTVA